MVQMVNDCIANDLRINFHLFRLRMPFLLLIVASQMYSEVLNDTNSEMEFINVLKVVMKNI